VIGQETLTRHGVSFFNTRKCVVSHFYISRETSISERCCNDDFDPIVGVQIPCACVRCSIRDLLRYAQLEHAGKIAIMK
jgi:hypothetical protein